MKNSYVAMLWNYVGLMYYLLNILNFIKFLFSNRVKIVFAMVLKLVW